MIQIDTITVNGQGYTLADAQARQEIAQLQQRTVAVRQELEDNSNDNLLKMELLRVGSYLNTNNGIVAESQNRYATEFLDLTNVERCFFYFDEGKAAPPYALPNYAFYDADKVFLEGHAKGTNYTYTTYNEKNVVMVQIPEGAQYMVISGPVGDITNGRHKACFIKPDSVISYKCAGDYYENYIHKQTAPKSNKEMIVVNLGDNLFGMYDDETSVSSQLSALSGATVYNCGFDGAFMNCETDAPLASYSLCGIADAIASGDFSNQRNNAGNGAVPDYFADRVERLAGIDFTQVDLVTIAYGTNDFASGVSLDDADYAYNINTVKGALRYAVEAIGLAYPNVRFVICTPMWRCWFTKGAFSYGCDTYQVEGKKLSDYATAIKEVAGEYHLPVCDYFSEMGLNMFSWSQFFTNSDGTNPHAGGRYLMAKKLARILSAY